MTQTLMDFLQIVTPATPARPAIPVPENPPLITALRQGRERMENRLSRLNRQIRNMGCEGGLIAVPLCPSACTPGDLAAFILSLKTDPFQRWNMMIYADSPLTADMLDTLPYHPDYALDTDAVMVDYLTGLQSTRDKDIAALTPHDDQTVIKYTDDLRTRLIDDCRQIELTLFGERKRMWRLQSDGTAAAASPPNAAINPAISSGTGAENRM